MRKTIMAMALVALATLTASARPKADSLAILTRLAAKGDTEAMNKAGELHYYGKGTPCDYAKALALFTKAAAKDYPPAIANMALCYRHGHGIARDTAKAIGLYQVAAKKGDNNVVPRHTQELEKTASPFAARLLYQCYKDGRGVPQDAWEALLLMADNKTEAEKSKNKQRFNDLTGSDPQFAAICAVARDFLCTHNYQTSYDYARTADKAGQRGAKTIMAICLASKSWKKHNAKKASKLAYKALQTEPQLINHFAMYIFTLDDVGQTFAEPKWQAVKKLIG